MGCIISYHLELRDSFRHNWIQDLEKHIIRIHLSSTLLYVEFLLRQENYPDSPSVHLPNLRPMEMPISPSFKKSVRDWGVLQKVFLFPSGHQAEFYLQAPFEIKGCHKTDKRQRNKSGCGLSTSRWDLQEAAISPPLARMIMVLPAKEDSVAVGHE